MLLFQINSELSTSPQVNTEEYKETRVVIKQHVKWFIPKVQSAAREGGS